MRTATALVENETFHVSAVKASIRRSDLPRHPQPLQHGMPGTTQGNCRSSSGGLFERSRR